MISSLHKRILRLSALFMAVELKRQKFTSRIYKTKRKFERQIGQNQKSEAHQSNKVQGPGEELLSMKMKSCVNRHRNKQQKAVDF